ncbi:hypothetical protein KQI63_02445 [bacterium]|nr:hypothetical protein [bacterium]
MVIPIHLQDNFSKTWIAQRMADESHTGAEKQANAKNEAVLRQLEKRQRQQSAGLEERGKLDPLDPRGRNRHSFLKKEKKEDDETDGEESGTEDFISDLRFRKDEDDRGKGDTLDIEG